MYRAIRINLQSDSRTSSGIQQLKQISRTAGRVYSKTVSLIRKTHEKRGFWISVGAIKKYLKLKDYPLHSQTTQALIEGYFDALKSYFKLRKNGDENACPPYKTKKYHSVPFKQSAIKVEDGKIMLSLGKGRKPLILDLPQTPKYYIRTAEICWDKTQRIYYLVLTIKLDDEVREVRYRYTGRKKSRYKKAKAIFVLILQKKSTWVCKPQPTPQRAYGKIKTKIDLGEIHPLVATDGKKTVIYNGRLIRSIKQYREKTKACFQSKIDQCEKYSRRWWKLNKSKWKQLRKINNQIKDARHKITRHFANSCKSERVGLVVIGDLTGIRDNIDYSKKTNQKLHQWAFAVSPAKRQASVGVCRDNTTVKI